MIICFKCSAPIKRRLDDLIASGAYSDYGEVIAIAVDNLAVLHDEVEKDGAVIVAPSRELRLGVSSVDRSVTEASQSVHAIPDIFRLDGLPADPPAPLVE